MKQYTYIQRRIYLRLAHSRTVICSSWSLLNSPRARAHIIIYKSARRRERAKQQHTNLHHHSRFNQPCNKSKYKSKDKIYRVIICGSARTGERRRSRGVLIAATRAEPVFRSKRRTRVCPPLITIGLCASCGQNIQLLIAWATRPREVFGLI
jgi:hypothetical protein